jgi:predicted DNA-binding transcriptional regulator YafY
MTVDASERLRRLLTVIPAFANAESMTYDELARRAGVEGSDVLDDLVALTDRVDGPGGFIDSIGVEFEHERIAVRSSHFLRPIRITIAELCALELGLAMLGAGTPPDERMPIDRARARLRKAIVKMPRSESDDAWYAEAPGNVDGEVVARLKDAATRSLKSRIAYRGANDVAAEERVIHAYALLPSHGTWYVASHCERSGGLRFFRADRIVSVALLDETFERPDAFDSAQLLTNGRPFVGHAREPLVVRYSPRIARWIAEREGKEVAVDGSLTLEHPLADERWAVRHVLQYGADAEVLSPVAVREAVRRTLEQITAAVS